ncbi:hypothetical protein QAD02_006052 [Eretmocerus hayati]|uniref:Uncharacterized protein n=1 Tax=Eretmocerus hayati TaxID=131215 RepID=A0ACC2MZZ3_9HYME|nr:hypothetical protein QAD02_006052 [Eretmocerus hayati]
MATGLTQSQFPVNPFTSVTTVSQPTAHPSTSSTTYYVNANNCASLQGNYGFMYQQTDYNNVYPSHHQNAPRHDYYGQSSSIPHISESMTHMSHESPSSLQPCHEKQMQSCSSPSSVVTRQNQSSEPSSELKRRRVNETVALPDDICVTPSSDINVVDTPQQLSSEIPNQTEAPQEVHVTPDLATIRSNNFVYVVLKKQGLVGKQIFAAYDKWVRKDDDECFAYFRPKIANFVMSEAMVNCHDVRRGTFEWLRKSWLECFPKEAEEHNEMNIYEPAAGGSDARGPLYTAYLYHRCNSFECDLLEKPKQKQQATGTDRAELQVLRNIKIIDASSIEEWVKRLHVRIFFYQKSTLDEMVDDLNILKDHRGKELVAADFGKSYPGKENALLDIWPSVSAGLVRLAELKVKKNKDADISDCLSAWPGGKFEDVAWFLLGLLFNGSQMPNKKIKKKDAVKFFIEIIQIKKDENLLDKLKTSQRDLAAKLEEKGDNLIPRVVCCRGSASKFFVVLNESTHYEVDSLTEAVNLCFKCLAVFPMCKDLGKTVRHIWGFIELYVFKIVTPGHGKTVIRNLISDLDRVMKEYLMKSI